MTTLASRPATALLVIDVQNAAVAGGYQRDAVVANIGSLIEKARREQVPVIWVQHSDAELERGSGDRRTRSLRTRTCTGPMRPRRGERPGP
jgi:nicotinamidase-related amidase